MNKIKILFLAANPKDTSRLSLEEEIRAIIEKIRASQNRDVLQLESGWAVRPDDLLQLLNEHKPHIVHFSGHGSQAGEIILVDNKGLSKPVSAQALKALFKTLKDNIQVIILNACYSRIQAEAITEVIDCVVGMNDAIGDEAAIKFAASFYRALGFGRSVRDAFDQGKVALLLEGIPEEDTPELIEKVGVDPSRLFILNLATTSQEQHTSNEPSAESEKQIQQQVVGMLDFRQASPSTVEHTEQVVPLHSERDFFISYNSADRPWAEWIAWLLEEKGYSTVLQDWDFRPGSNFVLDMQNATQETKRTIVVLSPHYLNAQFTQSEWAAAFQQDPKGEEGVLVPVRVQECKPEGLLGTIVYIDLVGLNELEAREKLLVGVRFGRGKPTSPPAFPEKVSRSMTYQSTFPGAHRNMIIPLEERPAPDSNSHSLHRWQMPRRFSRRTILIGLVGVVIVSGTAGVAWLVTLGGISMNNWTLNGNAGTHPPNDFLGTTDSQPLVLKVNGNEAIRVDASGKVGIGTTTPFTSLHVLGRIASGFGGTSAGAITFYPAPEQTAWFHIDNPGANGQATGHLRISYGGSPGEHTIMMLDQNNNVTIQGNLSVSGQKNFVQDHPTDPTREVVYVALEGGEASTYIRGTGTLVNGKSVIDLSEHFGLVTSQDGLTVQLTPRGEWLQLYVVELSTGQLVVREAQGKNGQFDYFIQGVRKGHEHHQVIREKVIVKQ